jgi:hypothetical protein
MIVSPFLGSVRRTLQPRRKPKKNGLRVIAWSKIKIRIYIEFLPAALAQVQTPLV